MAATLPAVGSLSPRGSLARPYTTWKVFLPDHIFGTPLTKRWVACLLPWHLRESWRLDYNLQNTTEVTLLPKLNRERKRPSRKFPQLQFLLLGCLFRGSQLLCETFNDLEALMPERPSEGAPISSPHELLLTVSHVSHRGHPTQPSHQMTFD